MELKEEQKKAIYTQDSDILVSAGAGSGKTFVMIERIAENLINKKADITNFLVVTFTNAAASEMRAKLLKKLNDALQSQLTKEQKTHIINQIEMVGQSDVCTLHKFCQNLITKYFYLIKLEPKFNIADESENSQLRDKVIEDVFDSLQKSKDADFALLSKTFDVKRNFNKLKEYIFGVYDFLTNQPNIENYRNTVLQSYKFENQENAFTKVINDYLLEMLNYYIEEFGKFKQEALIINYGDMAEFCELIIGNLSSINKNNDFATNFNNFNNISLPRIINKDDEVEFLALRDKVDATKKSLSKTLTSIKNNILLTSDLDDLLGQLKKVEQYIIAIFAVVQKFTTSYQRLKKDNNMLDFSDLEHYALEILHNPVAQGEIRERYQEIYVDEYQDINDIQEGIISCIHKCRNEFLVGDVKQSIYGFRNTNPQIFLDKQELFEKNKDLGCANIALTYNFRTDQHILDFVNYVFGRLMTKDSAGMEYMPNNEMKSGANYQKKEHFLPSVEIDFISKHKEEKEKLLLQEVYDIKNAPLIENDENIYAKSEANIIANKIIDLLKKQVEIFDTKLGEKGDYRKITFNDITLLARGRSKYLDILCAELSNLGIPIALMSNDSVFNEYEVALLYNYLRLINKEQDDKALLTLLLSPVINITEQEIATIRGEYADCESLYHCVNKYITIDNVLAEKLKYALSLISQGRDLLCNNNIYNVLNFFINTTNYYAIIFSLTNGINRVKNVKGYLASFINKKYNTNLSLYINSIEQNLLPPRINAEQSEGANVVHVETMHHSKGLEYPIVFLVNSGHTFNKEELKAEFTLHSQLGMGLYSYQQELRLRQSTIARSAIKIALNNKSFAENLRLLYVAMTRAKNHLYITGSIDLTTINSQSTVWGYKSCNNNLALLLSLLNPEELTALQMGKEEITLRKNGLSLGVIQQYPTINVIKETSKKEGKSTKLINIVPEFESLLDKNENFVYPFSQQMITAYKNTVTGLNRQMEENSGINYTSTPQKFEISENDVSSSNNAEIGTAFHKAMQLIDFNLTNENEVENFLRDKMSPDEFSLINCGKITQAIKNLRPIIQGARLLREQQFLMRIPHCDLVPNSNIKDCILIQGVVDLIVIKNNEIFIIDYKTTTQKDLQKLKEKYALQLLCYQKAVESALNCKITQKFLYFFIQECLISVDI